MKPGIICGIIARLAHYRLSLHLSTVVHQHSCADCTVIRFRANELELEPAVLSTKIIAQQGRGFVHVYDQYVYIAVVVEISKCAAST